MNLPGNIAVIGSGTWATALANGVDEKSFNWFIRKTEVIDQFYDTGHNPTYLSNVKF